MLYLEYHELLKKYKNAEKIYYNALDKKSSLLYLVEPHAVQTKEIINSLSMTNPDEKIIMYVSQIEEVDKLINETRNNKDALNYELNKKEILLKNSQNIYDKIYYADMQVDSLKTIHLFFCKWRCKAISELMINGQIRDKINKSLYKK